MSERVNQLHDLLILFYERQQLKVNDDAAIIGCVIKEAFNCMLQDRIVCLWLRDEVTETF